jgi:hypothetical protein
MRNPELNNAVACIGGHVCTALRLHNLVCAPGIGAPARTNNFFVSYLIDDLLAYAVMISTLFSLGILWHVVQTVPGLLESIGYVYGILLASFSLEALYAYMESDLD